ncbi:MAG: molybdopterin-binding protein [Syntrophomonadaceae bacterium]|jgi:molybdenum cofactor synthesis domain-containing protein|nr:molybdopterin-binding protein [Syntrophomonadaceae bacterium]
MRKVPVEEAVGMPLGHDITGIVTGKKKYRAFKRGHVITKMDIEKLLSLGKEHVYIWEDMEHFIHEDEASLRLAEAASGSGVTISEPNQGRVNLKAECNGLLKVQASQLQWLNNIEDIIFATLHNNQEVIEGQIVAGTRIIPLAIDSSLLQEAENLASNPMPLITVKPFKSLWVGVVTTGSEVNSGRIKDGFAHILRRKINAFGGRWMGQTIVPDEIELIAKEIQNFIAEGADLILVTGGMSVDADDATPNAICNSGAKVVFSGAPVLPGSHFMMAYMGHVAICGVPGGALFNRVTILDLIMPRIFAGERISRADIVALGHGGLCRECKICHFPVCPFGKSAPF